MVLPKGNILHKNKLLFCPATRACYQPTDDVIYHLLTASPSAIAALGKA